MKAPVLSVRHLSAGYKGHPAIADVSFELQKGEILCLAGESGCGKTTVLKALLSSPDIEVYAGEILLDGTDVTAMSPKEKRKACSERLGIVFQTPGSSFNPIRTYRKQFIETLRSHGKYDRDAFDGQAEDAFAKVELPDAQNLLNQCPYALSGGMNQRAALALALLLGQDILLCDEPTSALDATIQRQAAEELRKLCDENGVSQIIVTHNLALAGFLADRTGIMYGGRLVEIGRTEDVLYHPLHPYTRSLIRAVPSLDGTMPQGLPGLPPAEGPSLSGCVFRGRCPFVREACAKAPYALCTGKEDHYTACILREGEMP